MEESTPMTRLDKADPSHNDSDDAILSPAQEKLLEQTRGTASRPAPVSGSQPSATRQGQPATTGAPPPAVLAQPPEPEQSGEPNQPLRPAQEELIKEAQPTDPIGVLKLQLPEQDKETATSARALVDAFGRFLRSLRWATLLVSSILMLVTVTLLAVLVNQVLLFPGWLQPIGYVVLVVMPTVAGWVLYGLCRRFASLATTPRVQLGVEYRLDQASIIRNLQYNDQLAEVRDKLVPLVRNYELTQQRRTLLLRCGATHQQLEDLVLGRGQLIDKLGSEPSAAWVVRCHNEFYAILNDVARTCCHHAMKRLFVTTAAAPQGLIDSLFILFTTFNHLDDLCQIFNVKPRSGDSLRLFLWTIGHMAVAQPLEDMTDAAGDQVTSALGDWLSTGSDAAASIIAKAFGVFVGEVSNGAVHALLLRRVSAAACSYLIPLRVKEK